MRASWGPLYLLGPTAATGSASSVVTPLTVNNLTFILSVMHRYHREYVQIPHVHSPSTLVVLQVLGSRKRKVFPLISCSH
ncbi:hypothetical protein XELAEV_18028841mg [Xenopus laevis]|uniref:Uncharacterized protein n=1 Tax=Xenopus laevis TaxID=8355 RepID=A0A974HHK5_XENLA|nr:hypothetical protein XELAEV_18028841mg [Xenopus laevis]